MSFTIYYSNGKVVTAEEPSSDIPARDIQVIVQNDPKSGPYLQSGSHHYVWQDGSWIGVDDFGLYDYLLESGLVLFGRTITNKEYQEIYQQAKIEKSTWKPRERRP